MSEEKWQSTLNEYILVRANYTDLKNGIHATASYLDSFSVIFCLGLIMH